VASPEIIWLGSTPEDELLQALLYAFGKMALQVTPELQEGLEALAAEPERFAIAIADPGPSAWAVGALVPRIKQINPAIEVLTISGGSCWQDLELPRFQRPIMLSRPVSPDALVSSVAKLLEYAELSENYGQLGRSVHQRLALGRKNVEASIALLYGLRGVGMLTVRRDGILTLYDSEVRRLTGSSPGDLTHVSAWIASLAADPDQAEKILNALDDYWLEGAGRKDLKFNIRQPGGGTRVLSLSVLVLVSDKGDPRQLVLLLHDPKDKATVSEYEMLLASGELGVYAYYPDEGFARFSPAALELLNRSFGLKLTPAQVLGRQVRDLGLPPDQAQAWQDMLARAAAGQALERTKSLGLAGRHMFSHRVLAPLEREAEGPTGVVALVRPRGEAEDAQRAPLSGGLAGLTLQAMPYAVLMLEAVRGPEGEIEDFVGVGLNQAAWRLLDRVDFFRPGMLLADLFPDQAARERLFAEANDVCEHGAQVSLEIGVRTGGARSGSRLFFFWIGKVGDGAALMFEDVTTQRDQERRQYQYRHIFGHMEEAIIVTDTRGIIIDWNPAAERMFGYSKNEVLGKDTLLLIPGGRSQEVGRETRSVLREGDVWKGEYEFVRQNGTRGIALSVFALLKDDNGVAYGTVGLTHDVTERRRLQQNLALQSQELKEKNIALNTLLRHAEQERVRACEQVARDLAQRITQRIHQMLDHADSPEMVKDLAGLLLSDLGRRPEGGKLDPTDPTLTLSEKELEVARLIRSGKTSEQIALLLGKSMDTIRLQRISIRKKLGLTRRDHNLANYLNRLDLI
jgi:PAS domain S-box-containing protein